MTSTPRRAAAVLTSALAVAALPTILFAGHSSASFEPDPAASGHAAVIAQGVVDFPDGTFHWQVADGSLTTAGEPAPVPTSVTFVLAGTGVVEVAGDGLAYRLGGGEAAMLPAFSGAVLTTPESSATFWTLAIANVDDTGGVGATGGSFSATRGSRDVDLIRDVLAAGESLTIPDGDLPVLVLVTGGAVNATSTESGTPTDLAEGDAVTLDGEVVIANDGDQQATIVAGVIGATVESPELSATTTVATDADGEGEGEGEGEGSDTDGTGGVTTTETAADSDGDGLSDDAETNIHGSDPNNTDTDGDHVGDGDEVNTYGSNPTSNNSDGDYLTDGDEVNITHTNPVVADTDNDGLNDDAEGPMGLDPNDSDSDDDTFGDGVEVSGGTNPLDPNSHP